MTKSNEECKKIWNSYQEKVDKELSIYVPYIEKNTKHYAVIIEPREHPDLLLTLRNTMYHLNESNSRIKWGLQIFHGTQNEKYVKKLTKNWLNVNYVNIGRDNLTNIEHSEYMESNDFWLKVLGEKALIFQTDSLLLREGIDEFLEFDYVGAPWRKPKENQLVGNGGLSLRTISKMVEICDKHKPTEQIWEDIFFIKHLAGQGVADVETAKKFSMEDVYSSNPLGVHNPIRHIDPEILRSILFK